MKTLEQLHELSQQHPYYCSESNYYSNECTFTHNTFDDFLDEWADADLDMNLLFRWDLNKNDEKSYYMQLYFIGQRKGIFMCNVIESIEESDIPKILDYLEVRKNHLFKLWNL